MKLFRFGRNERLRGVDFGALIPAPAVGHEISPESGRVVLLVPRYRDPLFGRLIQPRLSAEKRYVRIPFDQRGTYLWPLLDGASTIVELAEGFQEAFPGDAEQAAKRIAAYLHRMYEHRFVEFVNISGYNE